jgi:hypothetical protein
MRTRWMRVAHKAAEIQGHVLFFLLYVLAVVPMGLMQPGSRRGLRGREANKAPSWRSREDCATDLEFSRRQY